MLKRNNINSSKIFGLLFTDSTSIDYLSFTITCPRITEKQSHRNNYLCETPRILSIIYNSITFLL